MVKIGRILRDYADAGGVNALLGLWGFVDDVTFMTKAGHVGIAYRLGGANYEGLSHMDRRDLVHQVEAALRLLDEHCRLYQYLVKSTVSPFQATTCAQRMPNDAIQRRVDYLNERRDGLYDLALYWVLMYEAPISAGRGPNDWRFWTAPQERLRSWLSTSGTGTALESSLQQATDALHQRARDLEVQLSSVHPRRLPKQEAFHFFRRLVNVDAARAVAARLTHDAYLDYFVADSAVDCHRDHLVIGDRVVKVLSMKEPPAQTYPLLLEQLYAIPGEFIACLEWQRIPNDRMRRQLQSRRRHFFNKRVSLVNYVASDTRAEDMLVDDSATATVRQLGDAITELEVHGHFFGTCSLTLVLHGDEYRALTQTAAEAMKAVAVHDGSVFEETYNLLNAWLGTVPGNAAYNLRRLALLETNAADLSFVFTLDGGDRRSPHFGQDALAVFDTPHHVPYAFNLHVEDVGHTLVLGATGSGKSFLVNFLVTHAQQYHPFTIILDIGGSYRKLATVLGGRYLPIGLRHGDVLINPFALDGTPDHLHFLHAFVRVLLEGADAYRLSEREARELYESVQNVYVLEPTHRRLSTLAHMLPRALADRLQKWIEGGRYGTLFDNVHDTLTLQRLQVFDFESMAAYPELLEPLLFYVLRRVTQRVQDPGAASLFKLCVMDEAWRFIQHPTLRAYVHEGLKTWRKRNGAMLLATQSIEDFASADLLRTVVEGCPTTLFLSNPSLNRPHYADLFHLNATELDLLTGLVPRQQILLKRPDVTKVLTLGVDAESRWIYTNALADGERVAAAANTDGVDADVDLRVP